MASGDLVGSHRRTRRRIDGAHFRLLGRQPLVRQTPGSDARSDGCRLSDGPTRFLSLIANVIDATGWRTASWGIAIAALALIPVIWLVLVDRPSDVGLLPYGADPNNPPAENTTLRAAQRRPRNNHSHTGRGCSPPHLLDFGGDFLRLRLDHQRDRLHALHPRRP